jgi:hypothetical protein
MIKPPMKFALDAGSYLPSTSKENVDPRVEPAIKGVKWYEESMKDAS